MLNRVILVMTDKELRRRIRRLLPGGDVMAESIRGRNHLWERAARRSADVIVASREAIPRPIANSIALFQDLPESPAVVVLCDEDDAAEHAELMGAGCDMVLSTALPDESLSDALLAVLDRRSNLAQGGFGTRRPLAQPQLTDFISNSPTMQAFLRVVRRVVQSDTSLLILGETGVGKERLAQAIHAEGRRSDGPFVAVNCGALPESLLESELFGHEEGAFTGATRLRRGSFELAHGGTIFLDEIGELASHLQVKLLRSLQEREVRRVGGEQPFKVDVRVMAASNRNLEEEVEAKRFRSDLFYRLSVVSLTVPPLRHRVQDIPALVESYIDYLRPRVGCDVHGIAPGAMEALCKYAWPGNVRELINVVERGMLLCSGEEIMSADLPETISGAVTRARAQRVLGVPTRPEDVPAEWLDRPLGELRGEITRNLERSYLEAMLRETAGRIGETARRAGIQPRSLYDKMKRYRLRKEDYRRNNARRN